MIKSKAVQSVKTPEFTYPHLMIAGDGEIVVFTGYKVGTVVMTPDKNRVGYHSRAWCMDQFTPWYGEVTLTQEIPPQQQ